jgi:hypothetical protein
MKYVFGLLLVPVSAIMIVGAVMNESLPLMLLAIAGLTCSCMILKQPDNL